MEESTIRRSPDLEKQIADLAEHLAKAKIDAAFAAWKLLTVEVLSLLVEKKIVTTTEIGQRLDKIDITAHRLAGQAPMTSDFAHQATLSIRSAFRLEPERGN